MRDLWCKKFSTFSSTSINNVKENSSEPSRDLAWRQQLFFWLYPSLYFCNHMNYIVEWSLEKVEEAPWKIFRYHHRSPCLERSVYVSATIHFHYNVYLFIHTISSSGEENCEMDGCHFFFFFSVRVIRHYSLDYTKCHIRADNMLSFFGEEIRNFSSMSALLLSNMSETHV